MNFNFESTQSKTFLKKKEKEVKFTFPYITLLKLDFEEKNGIKLAKAKQRRQIELSDPAFTLLGNPDNIALAEDALGDIFIFNTSSFKEDFIKSNNIISLALTKDKRANIKKQYNYLITKYGLSYFEDNCFVIYSVEGGVIKMEGAVGAMLSPHKEIDISNTVTE